MLHPASQQSPFMVDLHEQVGRTPPQSPAASTVASQCEKQATSPYSTLLSTLHVNRRLCKPSFIVR
jgi:hypothetical protein